MLVVVMRSLLLLLLCSAMVNGIVTDADRGAAEIISARGFPSEQHKVTTADGYILDIFRIANPGRPVTLLLPGLTCNCIVMLIQKNDTALPFQLYEAGFDVWLANFRGTTYGSHHLTLDPSKDAKFWEYSFDEMAKFDLPAIIHRVLRVTRQKKISTMIGHSQGGTVGVAALSAYHKQVQSRVSSFIALAPGIYVSENASSTSKVAPILDLLRPFVDQYNLHSFIPSTAFFKALVPGFCNALPFVCKSVVCFVAGCESAGSIDPDRLGVWFAHYPDNSSIQNLEHWGQLSVSKGFGMFDWGNATVNLAKYGSSVPPLYDFSTIKIPTYVFGGEKDQLCPPVMLDKFVSNAVSEGANITMFKVIPYGHGDFIWANNAHTVLYPEIVSIAQQQSAVF